MNTTAVETPTRERPVPKRQPLNFWIDVLGAFLFSVLLGTGILMKWILPPGTCDEAALKLWLGHARHWWGDIHFWVAMALIALILLHVYLHWKWVCSLWRTLVGTARSPKTWALGVVLAAAMAIPWLIPAEVVEVPADAAAATVDGTQDAVAPCGIAGLSCETCPAAGDRLFGGGTPCAEVGDESEEDEPAEAEAAEEEDTCAQCPNAGTCPSAGTCPGAAECPSSGT